MTTAQEWRARAYEIIGRTVVLEAHLDATLALVNAQDVHSVRRLATSVFPQLTLGRRVDLLADLDHANELVTATVPRLRMLVGLRNSLAHCYDLGEHDDETALFFGWNRGKRTRTRVHRTLPRVVDRTAMRIERNLWRVAGQYADLQTWAAFYGFDDDGTVALPDG